MSGKNQAYQDRNERAAAIEGAPAADPIFAAIKQHNALRGVYVRLLNRVDIDGEGRIAGADAERLFERTARRDAEALNTVAKTAPTTFAGLVAALRYLVDYDTETRVLQRFVFTVADAYPDSIGIEGGPVADPVLAALARLHGARRRAEAACAALEAADGDRSALEATYQAERDEEDDALAAMFEAQPTTPAAAAAVIRAAADHIDFVGLNDSLLVDTFTKAIRGAVDLLERSVRT